MEYLYLSHLRKIFNAVDDDYKLALPDLGDRDKIVHILGCVNNIERCNVVLNSIHYGAHLSCTDSRPGDGLIFANLHLTIRRRKCQKKSAIVYHIGGTGGVHHPLARPAPLFCDKRRRYSRRHRCLCLIDSRISVILGTLAGQMHDFIALEVAMHFLQVNLLLLTLPLKPTLLSDMADLSAMEIFSCFCLCLRSGSYPGAASFSRRLSCTPRASLLLH